jgi:hypothetical protein
MERENPIRHLPEVGIDTNGLTREQMNEPDLIAESRRLCHALESFLPTFHLPSVDATFLTSQGLWITVKLPSKLVTVVGSLAWRAQDFATLALDLFENKRTIPGAVITRSLMETTALVHLVHSKVKKALAMEDANSVDEFLIRCTGSRLSDGAPQSPSVMTAIESLDKEPGAEGYLKFYETLCEFAHPNGLGTFYAYANFDDTNRMTSFGHNKGMTKGNDVSFAVVFALEILLDFLGKLADLVPRVTKLARDTYPPQGVG